MPMPAAEGFLAVIMLDTRFPRPPGDIGNPETFSRHGIPVRYAIVPGASARRIIKDADPSFLQPFVDAAVVLAGQGAAMVTTSCGFLASYQAVLTAAVAVPVVTSSLLVCRHIARPGIVTFDAASLGSSILDAAGVEASTPVQGLRPGCELHRSILDNDTELDLEEACANVVEAALGLVRVSPGVEDIVLECTNMPPYRDAVAAATGRRVHDIETVLVQRWRDRGAPG